jgi:diguanylate cyclase (GGDEF)-like protein/PAS domain S-box-containing protein
LVGIPLLAMVAWLAYETYANVHDEMAEARSTATRVAKITAANTAQFLQKAEGVLAEVSRRPGVKLLDRANCDPALSAMRQVEPAFLNVITLDAQGLLVCSAEPAPSGAPAGPDRDLYFNDAVRTRSFVVGKPTRGFLLKRWVSGLAYPIFGDAGQVIGVVAASVDLANYQPMVTQWGLEDAIVGIVSPQGIVVAHSQDPANRVGTAVQSDAGKEIVNRRQGFARAEGLGGVDRILAFTPVGHYAWISFVAFDESSVLGPAWKAALQRGGFAVLVVLLIALATMRMSRRISGPIVGLSASIGALRRGSLEKVDVSPVAPAEIQDFAAEFNAMLDARVRAEAAVRESAERRRLFIEHAPAAIAMLDRDMRYVAVSRRWREDFGLGERDLTGLGHYDVFPDLPEAWKEIHRRCLAGEVARNDEDRFVRADGAVEWLRWEVHPWRDAAGSIAGLLVFSEVITERKRDEERIRRLNRVYAMLSSINGLIVRVHNSSELYREACRIAVDKGEFGIAWLGLFSDDGSTLRTAAVEGADASWASENLGTTDLTTLLRDEHGLLARAYATRRAAWTDDVASLPEVAGTAYRSGLGRLGYRSAIVLPLAPGGSVRGFLSLVSKEPAFFTPEELALVEEVAGDIAFAMEHLTVRDKADYLAFYDPLTGLANRSLFLQYVAHSLPAAEARSRQLVLLLGDISRFSRVNDTVGRHGGDELLRQVASRLHSLVRFPENLARVAGNCFAVFLPAVSDMSRAIREVEEVIRGTVRDPYVIEGQSIRISLAVGAAVFPNDANDAETLFRNAETALAKAQSSGVLEFYEPSFSARVSGALELESRLRRALDQDEFVLHYQPKVRLSDRAVTGLEALIRWNDPDTGLVPPARFIPLLEETGLIVEVGRWALTRAAADWLRWHAAGLRPPPVAVNVSPMQLRRKDFVDTVLETLEKFGQPQALTLEITESTIMENMGEMVKKLEIINGLGVCIAMDDFGTGYSSLAYISKLPIDALKIDRSFVIEMAASEHARNIVMLVVSLAKTLRLKVIAEGVDDEAQVDMLRELECDELQGYLVSRPLPPEEIGEWLAREPARS